MTEPVNSLLKVFSEVIQKLESENIPYMIVGSVASIVYGEPRMTKDMDLVVDIPPALLKKIEQLFPLSEFYCPPLEVLSDEMIRRGQFNIIHHESGLKIDFVFRKETEFSIIEFSRKKKIELWPQFSAFVASPEDIILKKLEYYREGQSQKHLNDIRGILANTETDQAYIEKWADKLGLWQEWKKAKT